MEEGSLRCDANVSLRPEGQEEFGTRTEIKNLNSFRFVQKAIDYEVERQKHVLEQGDKVVQETRLYDSDKGVTFSMRSKEEAHDYRYFPEPDLAPIVIDDKWIDSVRQSLPELPENKRQRFIADFKIPEYDAQVLTASKTLGDYYEKCVALFPQPKMVSNWIMGDMLRELKNDDQGIENPPITTEQLADLLKLIDKGAISGKMGKTVFEEMFQTGKPADIIVKEKGLAQISDSSAIEKLVEEILAANAEQVESYKNGKDKVFGYLVGQVMKASKGQANPAVVNQLLKDKLSQ